MKLISLVTIFAGFAAASALTRTECLTNCDKALDRNSSFNRGRCQQDCDSMTFNSRGTCPQNCRSNFSSGNRLDRCYEMCGTRHRFLETDVQSKVLDNDTAASVEAGRLEEGLPPTLTTVEQGQLSLRSSRARGECQDNCRLAGDRDPNFSTARCRQDCDIMSFNTRSTCSQNCDSNFSSGNRLDRCLDGCLAADSRSESRCLRARSCSACSDNCLSSTGSGSEQDLCFLDVGCRSRFQGKQKSRKDLALKQFPVCESGRGCRCRDGAGGCLPVSFGTVCTAGFC